ncbi:MAG: 50S ribosomal protein L9 [Clostridia bacterium]|nr:50S ribosomal protein L9 [Clostridia bacterium]MBR2079139.1 50S ribosomal protein L9 [Clostridia bacterium]MBR2417645.1 50S ribosomal protein L9 [Clostridia bacterium]
MKVVLKQDVKGLGKKGELVNASDGYARNFLFPKNLAVEANAQNMSELKNREQAEKYRIATETAAAKANAEKMSGKTIKITAKAGANGKLFGSVTSKELSEKIADEFGIKVDKKKIVVEDIKQFGTFEFEVKLYTGISAKLFVMVGE